MNAAKDAMSSMTTYFQITIHHLDWFSAPQVYMDHFIMSLHECVFQWLLLFSLFSIPLHHIPFFHAWLRIQVITIMKMMHYILILRLQIFALYWWYYVWYAYFISLCWYIQGSRWYDRPNSFTSLSTWIDHTIKWLLSREKERAIFLMIDHFLW